MDWLFLLLEWAKSNLPPNIFDVRCFPLFLPTFSTLLPCHLSQAWILTMRRMNAISWLAKFWKTISGEFLAEHTVSVTKPGPFTHTHTHRQIVFYEPTTYTRTHVGKPRYRYTATCWCTYQDREDIYIYRFRYRDIRIWHDICGRFFATLNAWWLLRKVCMYTHTYCLLCMYVCIYFIIVYIHILVIRCVDISICTHVSG